MGQSFLFVTNRTWDASKQTWTARPDIHGMLSWLYVDPRKPSSFSSVRQRTMPDDFRALICKQSLGSGQLFAFTPGARSFDDALEESIDLSKRLRRRKKHVATPLKGAFVGYSLAIQEPKFGPPNPVYPTFRYLQQQDTKIENGKESYRAFLNELSGIRKGNEVEQLWHFTQSAGTVLLQKAAALGSSDELSIDHLVVAGSPLPSFSFNRDCDSAPIMKASDRVTVYWARDDVVINYVEKYGTRGPAIGVRGPTDKAFTPTYAKLAARNCRFVDCSDVNFHWKPDSCNHKSYEVLPRIYGDMLAEMQSAATPDRRKIIGSNGLGFYLTRKD